MRATPTPQANRLNKLSCESRVQSYPTGCCAALSGHVDHSCEGQADALQTRRLPSRPWAAWPSWLANSTRRPQKRLCSCGFAGTWVSALGRGQTSFRIVVWSRGLSHSTKTSWQHCATPWSPSLRTVFHWSMRCRLGNAARNIGQRCCMRCLATALASTPRGSNRGRSTRRYCVGSPANSVTASCSFRADRVAQRPSHEGRIPFGQAAVSTSRGVQYDGLVLYTLRKHGRQQPAFNSAPRVALRLQR